jgi:uncharacterized protein YqgC (DUF456 family)
VDALTLLTALAIVAGLVGTVLVVFPGILVVWGAVLVWALLTDDSWRWVVLGAATAILVASTVLKYLLPGRHLSESGVPGWSIAASAVAGIVGFFVIPVVGFFVGFVGGLLVVELLRLKDWSVAWPATLKALTAVGFSVAIELFAGLLIAAAWGAAVLAG